MRIGKCGFNLPNASAAVLVCICLLAGCAGSFDSVLPSSPASGHVPVNTASPVPMLSFSDAIDKVLPSVVYIYIEKNKQEGGQPVFAGGSGVVLRPDGYILTNKHVIEDARRILVTLQDRRVFTATRVMSDHLMDLAVVKIDAKDLPVPQIGNPDALKMGDIVIALGNPLGISPEDGAAAASVGIVSKQGSSFVMEGVPYYDVVQTDAAINTGNSGGPLINMKGEVVGINSAHALFAQNMGYAIGMNTAVHIFNELADYGKADHPFLGINAEDLKPSFSYSSVSLPKKPVVTDVMVGTPADAAGIKPKDIIVRVNDQEVNTVAELIKVIWRLNAGDKVKLTVQREGNTLEIEVILATRPEDEPLPEQ